MNYRAYVIGKYDLPCTYAKGLEVIVITRDWKGTSFEAQAPGLNDSGNGEIYSASTDPSLEDFTHEYSSAFYCVYDPEKFHCVHFVILAAKVIFGKDYTPCFWDLLDHYKNPSRLPAIQFIETSTSKSQKTAALS